MCSLYVICRWFSPGPPLFSPNKTNRQDIAEILLKVALSTNKSNYMYILVLNCIGFHFI